ncbi:class I SAM-dependent methyltransferase [Paenibacillus sp. QZ-Y1]|uniref:class I SAM-dependent methyltransferase n=1 Tax=Paenibacillus sp. QZ-Y1 TaxID=3414511 RepID=UPI003F7AC466
MSDEIKSQVQKQFAINAGKYVTSAGHAKGEDLALLVASSQATSEMNVLDVATGGGHVANALAPLVEKVTALDLTEEMLQVAEHFIRGNGHLNVDFVVGDAERLPFDDDFFDLVTCRIAAHHFPDVSSFVSETLRVIKPGGRLLLIDNVAPERDEIDQFYNEVEKWRDASHVRAWRKTEWIQMLEFAGFRMGFMFEEWCNRAALPESERRELEASMLSAPSIIKKVFNFEENGHGGLISFQGESVYIQAVKPNFIS